MGATHSASPLNSRQRNYECQSRDSLAYSTNFGTVRFRSNQPTSYSRSQRSSIENNNNTVKCTDPGRPQSYAASTTSTKKNRSIFSSSWNFAKRTASAVPSLLNGSNRSTTSLSSRESNSISSKRHSITSNQRIRHLSGSRQISASSSHDSSISCIQPVHHIPPTKVQQDRSRRNLDEINCNSLSAAWELADRNGVNRHYNKPVVYARNKSQDSLNLYNCHKYYDDQDLTNNNTLAQSPPRQMPNFINSLDQFANRSRNVQLRNGKLEKNQSSLSTNSEFSSNASTESTSSFSAYNLATQTKQMYLNATDDYSEDEVSEDEEPANHSNHLTSMLPSSCSQHSFLSPSDSFDNGVNGNVFGRNVIISSSTADLLRGLGRFVSQHTRISNFEPAQLVMWLRSIDRALLIQGWQDCAFITAANLVFVFLLVKEQLARECEKVRTLSDLQSLVCCCLYVSYSYLGNEISYPLKPFISQHENRAKFWTRSLEIINSDSELMLRLNHSTEFFLQLFNELRDWADLERC
ncbi:Cyclin-dependent kinase 5 activator protein [Aphelenchoides bicaudatus]|nr:Cyclin-dependent kinase 5 activator protein [Aphelenchoides bicaudatus]